MAKDPLVAKVQRVEAAKARQMACKAALDQSRDASCRALFAANSAGVSLNRLGIMWGTSPQRVKQLVVKGKMLVEGDD